MLAFLRGLSPSGGSWSRPPALAGHCSPLSRALCRSTPERHCPETKASPLRSKQRGDQVFARFFSLLGCPWSPAVLRDANRQPCVNATSPGLCVQAWGFRASRLSAPLPGLPKPIPRPKSSSQPYCKEDTLTQRPASLKC